MISLRRFAVLLIALCLIVGPRSIRAELLYGVFGSTLLVAFDSANPGVLTTGVNMSGIQGGIVGLDFRPANGLLYGLSSANRLYIINPSTGVATPVGSSGLFSLSGTAFGMDFNPTVDRIRVVSDTEQNIRLNPNDGSLSATDTNLSPPGNVVAAAYTNNFAGASVTTLYGIDSISSNLVLIGGVNGSPSPNAGAVSIVGPLNVAVQSSFVGFDISGVTGIAYASINTSLYSINLATGAATSLGQIGPAGMPFSLHSLTAAPIPEPQTWALVFVGGLFLHRVLRLRKRTA